MRLKTKADLAVNKLILLFLASRMPSGLEHDEFVRFNMEGDWMLYFELEQFLPELISDGLLALRENAGQRLYAITAQGLNILGLLKTKIPLSVRSMITGRVAERRHAMERDQEISADYTQDSACEFPVSLRLFENQRPLLEMNLTAPSAEAAQLVCDRFRGEGADIYAALIERLTRDEKPKGDPNGNL